MPKELALFISSDLKDMRKEREVQMKIFCSADVRLGAICSENLSANLSHKWQKAREEKLERLAEIGQKSSDSYLALLGHIFGRKRVSESVVDSLFKIVREAESLKVLLFLNMEEADRLSYRNDIPENLFLLSAEKADRFLDDNLAACITKESVEIQLSEHEPLQIVWDEEGLYTISGKQTPILSFEPIGFEEAQINKYGYTQIEWTNERIENCQTVIDQVYTYATAEVKILPGDRREDIMLKINNAVREFSPDTFLRINLLGRSEFGLMIQTDNLAAQLQNRFFSVQAYDNTAMDIDEDSFAHDISLGSEFVRLALQDETLSESERARLISLGWNALGGRRES